MGSPTLESQVYSRRYFLACLVGVWIQKIGKGWALIGIDRRIGSGEE